MQMSVEVLFGNFSVMALTGAERGRLYRQRHPARIRAAKRRHYREHKEAHKKKWQKWYLANGEKRREYARLYYTTHKDEEHSRFRRWALQRKYGLTPAAFEQLLTSQGNRCAICRTPFKVRKEAHVDHEHGTRAVRGVLCGNCNLGMGNFKDNPALLLEALDYLSRFYGGVSL